LGKKHNPSKQTDGGHSSGRTYDMVGQRGLGDFQISREAVLGVQLMSPRYGTANGAFDRRLPNTGVYDFLRKMTNLICAESTKNLDLRPTS